MRYSYSKLMDAYKCYRLFKLKHIDGEQDPIKSADMEFGTTIHFVIAELLKPDEDLALDADVMFSQVWSNFVDADLNYTQHNHDALGKKGLELIRKFAKLHLKDFVPFKVEERMDFSLGGVDFTGKPDFIGLYKGVPSIVDFKTSARAYANYKKINSDEQMALYARASDIVHKYPIQKIVYKILCKDDTCRIQTQELNVTPKWIDSMCANAVLLARDLKDRLEFPMNRWHCQSCNFFDRCYGGSK